MKMAGFIGGLLIACAITACSGGPYDPNNATEAEAQCQGFVDQRIKSPASAEYDLNASEADGAWTVTGTVDSENGFSAMLRSDVTCVLHFEGGTAHLDDIVIS